MSVGLLPARDAPWWPSTAEMGENKEFGGGAGHGNAFTRRDDRELCAHRQKRAAVSGLQSRNLSKEPSRNLLRRPESRSFPVIPSDRHQQKRFEQCARNQVETMRLIEVSKKLQPEAESFA